MEDTERTPLLANANCVSNDGDPPKYQEMSSAMRYGILAGLWAGTFLSNINLTMVATLLPAITSEFKESNQASWIGTSYLLSTCTFTPLYGRLCTIIGRRAACRAALLSIAVGTLLCGLSKSMTTLIVARFVAGMGGGSIHLLAMIVTADLYGIRERGLPQAAMGMAHALGLTLGGPTGGFLNDLFGWRAAFLSQMPFFVLTMVLLMNTLNYITPGRGRNTKEVLSRIDFGGCVTLFLMIGSSLTWLSMRFNDGLPWTDSRVVFTLFLSVIFLTLFLFVEGLLAPEPILPLHLFCERVPLLTGLSNHFMSMCNLSVIYFLPMWFQTVALDSASIAGLHLLPESLTMGFGSLFAGWLIHRTGKYKTIDLVFGVLPLCGVIPLVYLREDSGFVQKWLSVVPIGFGNGVAIQTMLIALQAHLSESEMASGTAFGQLFRWLGQTSGVAVASAVFQSRLDVELRRRIHAPDADQIIADVRRSLSLVKTLHDPVQRQARDAYAASLEAVFVVATIAALVACIVRWPIPDKVMCAESESEGDVEVEDEQA